MYIWIFLDASSVSLIKSSLLSAMLRLNGSLPAFEGSLATVGVFSMALMLILNHFARWCSGPLCFLVLPILLLFMILYSRCSSGRVAILVNTLWHHLFTSIAIG